MINQTRNTQYAAQMRHISLDFGTLKSMLRNVSAFKKTLGKKIPWQIFYLAIFGTDILWESSSKWNFKQLFYSMSLVWPVVRDHKFLIASPVCDFFCVCACACACVREGAS